jgi:hypothetical protein
MNGWEVAKQARGIDPVFPVIYMTGAAAQQWGSHGVPNSILVRKDREITSEPVKQVAFGLVRCEVTDQSNIRLRLSEAFRLAPNSPSSPTSRSLCSGVSIREKAEVKLELQAN